jgi:DNA repair exonuclease SbcCD ATPase subunit
LTKLAEELAPLREKRTKIESVLGHQRESLAQLNAGQDVEDLRFRSRIAEARVKRCVKGVERRKKFVEEAQAELKAEKENASAETEAYEKLRSDWLAQRARNDAAIKKASGILGSTRALRDRLRGLLDNHMASENMVCQTCEQPLPKSKHVELLAKLKAEFTEASRAYENARTAYQESEANVKALTEPERPIFPAISLAQDSLVIEQKRLDQIVGKLDVAQVELSHATALLDRATNQVTQMQTGIAKNEKDLASLIASIADKEKLSEQLTFWVEAFGTQGLRSFLIESEISEINKRATVYAQRLLGPGAGVQLSATTQLKTKDVQREKLSIVANIPGCTTTYAGASKGQKRRLDLSLLLAFRDIVAGKSSGAFRQFFADELFDGLDQTGDAFVVELLREISDNDCPVVLVTHSQYLKSSVDRLITVSHEKEFLATVTTSSGMVSGARISKKKKLAPT